MGSNVVPFAAGKLPAHLRNRNAGGVANVFAAAVSAGGFPVVSIKGKVFHIQRGDERELVTAPGDDEAPAASIEVVVVGINPHKSKVYYSEGYQEGSVDKPTCYSNDGIAPGADAQEPQAKKCATCVHNQWGSRITDSGSKAKACSDSMRLAIAPAGQINDPMLIRVPATSLKPLGQYGEMLAKRGVLPHQVVTKIGFDHSVSHPALTFKAIRFVSEEELEEVDEVMQDEMIGMITGTAPIPADVHQPVAEDEDEEEEAPAPKRKAPAKKAAAKKARKPVVVEEDEDEDEDEDEEEVVAPKRKAAKKPVAEVEEIDDLSEALDNLEFDD